MSMLPGPGLLLRSLVVLVWLGLFGAHATGHLLDLFGFTERRDLPALVTAHVGYTYRYALHRAGEGPTAIDEPGRPYGYLSQSFDFDEGRYPVRFDIDLTDLTFLPVYPLLETQLRSHAGIDLGRGVAATLITTFDGHFRLDEVVANADLGGRRLGFDGRVDHTGLRGNLVSADGSIDREIDLPQVSRRTAQNLSILTALPAGLTVGERFTMPSLTPSPTPPHLRQTWTSYTVEAEEEYQTIAGPRRLLRIRLERQGSDLGTLYCDERGVVFAASEQASGMRLTLTSIHYEGGRRWPEVTGFSDSPASSDELDDP